MKKILLALVLAPFLAAPAPGIPQNFNQGFNNFLQTAGVSFEQVAEDPATWAQGAELKGKWKAGGDGSLVLAETATVFGLPADEVTAQRRNDAVQSFRVVFREKAKAGAGKKVDLYDQVSANVRALTGGYGAEAKDGGTEYKDKNLVITVRRGKAREVVVVLAPAT